MENLTKMLIENKDFIIVLIAFMALVTSFLSIILTYISIRAQKTHFVKSVKPISNFSIKNYDNEISVAIKNCGCGPLIIDSFKVVDDKGEDKEDLIKWMPELPKGIYWSTYFTRLPDNTVLPEQSITLLKYIPDLKKVNEVAFRDNVRKTLAKLTVELTYKDIYENKLPKHTKTLDWFGRHFK